MMSYSSCHTLVVKTFVMLSLFYAMTSYFILCHILYVIIYFVMSLFQVMMSLFYAMMSYFGDIFVMSLFQAMMSLFYAMMSLFYTMSYTVRYCDVIISGDDVIILCYDVILW